MYPRGDITLTKSTGDYYVLEAQNAIAFFGYLLGRPSWVGTGVTRLTPSQISLSFPKSDQVLVNSALDKLYHSVNEASGLENLIESHALWPSFRKSALTFKKVFGTGTGKLSRSKLLRLGRFVSGAYLFYSFAVAPLMRDLETTRRLAADLQRQIAKYLSRFNKPQRYSASCTCVPTYDRGEPYDPEATTWHIRWEGEYSYAIQPTRRVVIVGQTDRPMNVDLFNKADFFIEKLGAQGPASLAWEFIPFSFVLDWFVDTGALLGSWDNFLTGSRTRILAASISTVYDIRETTRWNPGQALDSYGDLSLTPFSSSRVKYYHRESIEASPKLAINSRFGKKQLALSSALVYQMVANLKRYKAFIG